MDSTRRGALILGGFGALAVALHVKAGNTFPIPWVDEIDFLSPAVALAREGSLDVPALAAPGGMYWVSDAIYLVLAPFVRIFPATVETGRWVSLAAVLLAATGFWVAARRVGAHAIAAATAAGLWLVAPKVVLAGNITRHEAIVLACVAWALVALFTDRRVGAITLAALAAVVHPAGAAFAAVIGLAALLRPSTRATSRGEWLGAGALGAFLGFEVVHFATNWGIASEQLSFQWQRKAGRAPRGEAPFLAVAYLTALFACWRFRRTVAHPALVFSGAALAGAVVNAYGHEMWYGVYGIPTTGLLLSLGALAAVPHLPVAAHRMATFTAATASAIAVFAFQGYETGFHKMRLGTDQKEWTAFTEQVRAELVALDAATTEDTVVVINSLSGLPWPAEQETFGNVRIVKETTVSAADDADYRLYARTFCCTGNISDQDAIGDVVATVESPTQRFDATLFKVAP